MVHEIVQTIKPSLNVDWSKPSREEVRAGVWSLVKPVLRKKEVREEDLEPFLSPGGLGS